MTMKIFDPTQLSGQEVQQLLTELVAPRPIALVTTRSREDELSCSSFSYYGSVCGQPPLISLSVPRSRSSVQTCYRNILLNGEFVVHTPRPEHLEAVDRTGDTSREPVTDIGELGFSTVQSDRVQVPALEELPVRMECRLHDQLPLVGGKVTVLFGEVVCFHVEEDVWSEGSIDFDRLNPLARLGRDRYATLAEYHRSGAVSSEDGSTAS